MGNTKFPFNKNGNSSKFPLEWFSYDRDEEIDLLVGSSRKRTKENNGFSVYYWLLVCLFFHGHMKITL